MLKLMQKSFLKHRQIFYFLFSAFELLNHPRELARQITLIDHGKTYFVVF